MKKLSLFSVLLSLFAMSSAQDTQYDGVPASVISAFEKTFPGSKPKSWEQEKYGLYEAEFVMEGKPASATFNANGLLMRTEKRMPVAEMPPDIIEHARKLYPEYKISECAVITTPDEKLMYEVEIALRKERKSLIFSENNEYMREEMDEDDDSAKKKKSGS